MIIKRYGIELHRLRHKDIELVRRMRNRADIRSRMFYQETITSEQQEKWFLSINNKFNYYFLIKYKEKAIGLIYGKEIDYVSRSAEGGIFIWDLNYLGSGIPAKASIIMMELSFETANMDKIYAKVRSDNLEAVNYNKSLGYVLTEDNHVMVLTKESYEKRIKILRKYLI